MSWVPKTRRASSLDAAELPITALQDCPVFAPARRHFAVAATLLLAASCASKYHIGDPIRAEAMAAPTAKTVPENANGTDSQPRSSEV